MMNTPIVVCGTGIVGLATALGLVRRGQQVTLLGPRQTFAPATPETFHPRVYAISPASQRFLASLGVWNMLEHSHAGDDIECARRFFRKRLDADLAIINRVAGLQQVQARDFEHPRREIDARDIRPGSGQRLAVYKRKIE